MKSILRVWKSKFVQGVAAGLLNFTVTIILLTSVPGWKPPDWPWNLMAISATGLAFLLALPWLLEGKKKDDV